MNAFDIFFNLEVLQRAFPILLRGLGMTLLLGAVAIVAGSALGIGLAMMRLFAVRPLRLFAIFYIDVMRAMPVLVVLILIAMLCIDVSLFSANLVKVFSGGWLPLTLALMMFIVMTTWKSERFRLLRRMHEHGNSLEAMIASLEKSPPVRVPGTAVYMSRALNVIPFAMLHNLKHNKVLHERVVLLTLRTEDAPYVHNVRRVTIEQLSPTFWRVVASYGWRETPNVEEIFHRCGLEGLNCRMMETSFFMSHESLIIGKRPWYLRLRGKLYLLLQRNALRAPDQFEIPPNRVIELGTQVEI
mgnify:CR=1 FL=1